MAPVVLVSTFNPGGMYRSGFFGTLKQAEAAYRNIYRRANRVERKPGQTIFRYQGFSIHLEQE